MFCTNCSFPLDEGDRFCARCGRLTVEGKKAGAAAAQKLRRSASDKKIAGVCEGVARRFNVNPTWVRAGWVGASVLPFSPGLLAYMICWAVIPREDRASGGGPRGGPREPLAESRRS